MNRLFCVVLLFLFMGTMQPTTAIQTVHISVKQPHIPHIRFEQDSLKADRTGPLQWYFNGLALEEANKPHFVPTQPGIYWVVAYDSSLSCSSQSDALHILVTGQTAPLQGFNSRVSFQPIASMLSIHLHNAADAPIQIRIADLSGRILYYKQHLFSIGDNLLEIPIPEQITGVCLIEISQKNIRVNHRILMKR